MTNVRRSIKILKMVVIATIILVIVGQFWFWLEPFSVDLISATHPIISEYGGIGKLDSTQRAWGFAVTLIPKLALLWSMLLLLQLANALEAGRWFDRECENCCTRIGRWLIVYVALTVVHRTFLVMVITMNNPVGERHLALSVSSDDLMALVPALLALIIGHMVKLARAQRDELNEIV